MNHKGELYHGPIPKSTYDESQKARIREMLESDDELLRAYGEVYANGCFVVELTEGLAAVGSRDALETAKFRTGQELEIGELKLGDCVALGLLPGHGDTRVEAVRKALAEYLESAERSKDPDALDLYGTFSEGGYLVKAFMPVRPSQTRQWTIRVYEEGAAIVEEEAEPLRERTIRMVHEPVFGPDASDVAALEDGVEELMRELVS